MEKVICVTFFFGNDITLYANMKNSGNLVSHNSSYLKTVVCFFSSARFFSKDVKLVFFVNDIQALVSLENGYHKNIFEQLGVEIIEVTPRFVDQKKKWAGSMFVFDAIEYILNQKDSQPFTKTKKGYFFFDTDVIFLNNFERVFNIIEKYNWGGYVTYTEYSRGNNWLEDFHGINFETDNKNAIPYGGEFLYLDSHTIDIFFNVFKDIYSEKRNIYYTEEHYYSAIFNTPIFLDKRGVDVHTFFKRVWRINKSLDDQYAWALHFPGEKNYKLNYLFNELIKNNFIYDPKKAKKILGLNTFFNYYDFKKYGKYLNNVIQKNLRGKYK